MAEQNFDNSQNTAQQMVEDAWSDQDKIPLIKQFLKNHPQYEQLCAEVEYILRKSLDDTGVKYAIVSGRAKTLESFLEKIHRKFYENPLTEIEDFAGVRVVFLYLSDRKFIEEIIEEEFCVLEKVDKIDKQEHDRFGYAALHYVVDLGAQLSGARYDALKDLKCEIQVRTILQDAWAIIDHHLAYKRGNDMPTDIRRGLNALAGAFDVADNRFDALRTEQQEYIREAEEKMRQNDLEQPFDVHTLEAYLRQRFPDRAFSLEGYDLSCVLSLLKTCGLSTLKDLDSLLDDQAPLIKSIESSEGSMGVTSVLRCSLMAANLPSIASQYSSFFGGGSKQQSLRQTIQKHQAKLLPQDVEKDQKAAKNLE